MLIPLNDLHRQYSSISEELEQAVSRVVKSGWYILGPEVESFEREFSTSFGFNYCVGVSNGTDALELALRALDIGSGDQVATVANAGMYSTTAIKAVGATPLYVEIDPTLMTMNPQALARVLTPNTRAVIVTHLYGQMAELEDLLAVANQAGIPIIEDCAQAHGASLNGKYAGSWGLIGCFSFYPTKNLGAIGDGGALVTSDNDLAKRLRRLRQYGWTNKYQADLGGGRNSRLDELQAAVLRVKLPYLQQWNQRRREIAEIYTREFKDLDIITPNIFDESYVAHLYVVRTRSRDQICSVLANQEIKTEIHYPIPDHQQAYLGDSITCSLPLTEQYSQEVFTLPCFPELTNAEVERVVEAMHNSMLEVS